MKFKVKCAALIFAAVALCTLAQAGRAHQEEQPKHAPKTVQTPEAESDAARKSSSARTKELYEARCAKCHGADGRGQTRLGELLGTPDFTKPRWISAEREASDERLRESIEQGKDRMPAFGNKLLQSEINALVAHVRQFAKEPRAEKKKKKNGR